MTLALELPPQVELEERVQAANRNVPILRWKLALEMVTSGRYLDLSKCPLGLMQKTFARLKGSHDRALGYRVPYMKAAKGHVAQSDDELSVSTGETVAMCSVGPEGWKALGFVWEQEFVLCAAVEVVCIGREVCSMVARSQFQVQGRIGKVPRECLVPYKIHKVVLPTILAMCAARMHQLLSPGMSVCVCVGA